MVLILLILLLPLLPPSCCCRRDVHGNARNALRCVETPKRQRSAAATATATDDDDTDDYWRGGVRKCPQNFHDTATHTQNT